MSYYRARYERKQKNREDMFDRYKGYGLIRGCMVTEQEQAEWAFEEKDYEFEEFQNYGGKSYDIGIYGIAVMLYWRCVKRKQDVVGDFHFVSGIGDLGGAKRGSCDRLRMLCQDRSVWYNNRRSVRRESDNLAVKERNDSK